MDKPTRIPLIAERVEKLEKLMEQFTKELLLMKQYTVALSEIVSVITEHKTLDQKELMQIIEEKKKAAAKADVEIVKAKIQKGLADKLLVYAGEVMEDTVIVGKEMSEQGEVLNEYSPVVFADISDNLKGLILGKGVGDVIEVPESKQKFEILEIYANAEPSKPVLPVEVEPKIISSERN